MLQNLLSKLKKSLLLAMLALSFPQISWSDTLQVKKDIFLIDVSGSMQGRGSVSTPNVFDEVKRELSSALSKAKHSRVVLIPFSDKVRAGLSVELPQDSSLVSSYIEHLNTSEGRTDIYRAWMAGLDSLHSDASGNRLYLITDALHNSKKYSLDSLRSLLSLWEGENKEAYLVLLDPAFDSSELASAFRSHERMHVVNSLQGMYDQVELDTIQKEDAVMPAKEASSTTEADGSFPWWLWVLLAVLLGGVIVYLIYKYELLGPIRSVVEGFVCLIKKLLSMAKDDGTRNVFKEAKRYYRRSDGDWDANYNDIPKYENKERHTLRELVDNTYGDSLLLFDKEKSRFGLSEESIRLIGAMLRKTMTRIDKDPLEKLRRLDGQPNFFSRRLGDVVVRSVTAQELLDSGVDRLKIKEAIREENYRRLGVAFSREWKVSPNVANSIFGSLLHCTVHEDIAGYVFLVRVTLHRAIWHDGAASRVQKEVLDLLAKGVTSLLLNEEKD